MSKREILNSSTAALGYPKSNWAERHPLGSLVGASVAIGLFVVLSLVGVQSLPRGRQSSADEQLVAAFEALDAGRFRAARELIAAVGDDLSPSAAAESAFVFGAAAAGEAANLRGAKRRELYALAVDNLSQAREQGFPDERRAAGLLLLGQSLQATGRMVESRAPLEEALAIDPSHRAALHRLLALAYNRASEHDLSEALAHIVAYLSDQHLRPADRHAGLLEQLRILYKLHDDAACDAIVSQIPRTSAVYPDAQLIYGRIALRVAGQVKRELSKHPTDEAQAQIRQAYARAIEILERAQDQPRNARAIRRSMYLIGVCMHAQSDDTAALKQFAATRSAWPETEEGQAAALGEADLLRRAGHTEAAVAAYQRLLGTLREPFANAWVDPEEFRGHVLDAYRRLLRDEKFAQAVTLSAQFSPLFSPARAADYHAEALRVCSTKMLADSGELNETEALTLMKNGRAMARKAGRLFAQAAQMEFATRQYPDDVWRAAESFLAGHDFRSALANFRLYVQHEPSRRRAAALVNQGECCLALGYLDKAVSVCQQCIEHYPTDVASYRARLVAGDAYFEQKECAKAAAVLSENLHGKGLTPESHEWRDTLFRLGEVLAFDGRYEPAIDRLDEAVRRYPDTPQAARACYLMGQAHRQLADRIRDRLPGNRLESSRPADRAEWEQQLKATLRAFDRAREMLTARQQRAPLSALDRALLRNATFALAAAAVDLKQYDAAIQAYSTIVSQYSKDPAALEALAELAACYRATARPREARQSVAQAKALLEGLPVTVVLTDATNHTRRDWMDWLDWLAAL